MLYYLLFWTFLGFIIHFYIIFGTNLLTGGPAQIAVFFAYFSVSQKKNIKLSLNGMKPSGMWFSHRTWPRRLGPYAKASERWSWGWGAPPLGSAPCLVGPSVLHRRTSFSYISQHTPKTSREPQKKYFRHRNLLYLWDLMLEPSPALCQRGNRPRRASTSTSLPLQWVVSSLPQTYGSIVIS